MADWTDRYNPLKEYNCGKCGKAFIPPYNHVFKEKGRTLKVYCSWSCWNHRKDKDGDGGGA